jgi:hypothetical protein
VCELGDDEFSCSIFIASLGMLSDLSCVMMCDCVSKMMDLCCIKRTSRQMSLL